MKTYEAEINGFRTKMYLLGNIIIGIPTDLGPRILYVANAKRPDFNLFGVLPKVDTKTSEGVWKIIGGHRLWSSPETMPRSYSLDDKPVKIDVNKDTVTVQGNPELSNSIQKTITIKPFSENSLQVGHTISNIGRWPIQFACWALSVMRPNGFAIVPIKPEEGRGSLLPDRHITIWPYTDLSDERLEFTDGYIFLKQRPNIVKPVKVGVAANPSWTAYWVDGVAFVKEFAREEAEYPDYGCNVEVYANSDILELETLGPLRTVEPTKAIEHTEIWKILDVGDLATDPESVEHKLTKQLNK